MLRPAMYDIIKKGDNYYEFVLAVALRAREITDAAQDQGIELIEKPVEIAVEEFAVGKIRVSDYI